MYKFIMNNKSRKLSLTGKGYSSPWEYAKIPIREKLRIDGEMTFSTWVYRENAGGDWRNLYDIPSGHLLEFDPSGRIRWRAENDIGTFSVTSESISEEKWHHIAGTIREENGKFRADLYVDGILKSSQKGLGEGVTGGNDDLYLGILWTQRNGNADPWSGHIDDFSVWDKGLTQEQIKQVYAGNIQSEENLVLQLTFDNDSNGKVIDSSGNFYDGKLINSNNSPPPPDSIAASPSGGNNIQFSGNKFSEPWEYIKIDKSSSLEIEGEITISSWIYRLNAQSDWRNLYDIPGAHLLEFSPTGGFDWRAENNNIDFNINGPQIKDGEWAHITARATKLPGANKFSFDVYVNGEKASSNDNWQMERRENSAGVRQSGEDLYLGILWSQRNGNPDPWAGAIDDFRIWNSALSDQQIKDVYRNKHVSLKSLVAEFNFDDDTNTTIKDSSGNNNNGKLVGGQLNRYPQSRSRSHILGKLYPNDISGGNNHFAIINKNNIVKNVIVMTVETALNDGARFIDTQAGEKLVQTSYDGSFRHKYAGIGDKYDKRKDVFNRNSYQHSYQLSISKLSIDEDISQSIRINISTSNVESGTRLYYTISGSGVDANDFSFGDIKSSRLIDTAGTATFLLSTAEDQLTEGNESFNVNLYTDYQRTQLVATSEPVTILDTIKMPAPPTTAAFILLKLELVLCEASP